MSLSWGAGISLKGVKGDQGISVLTGSGAPGSLAGVQGQSYIDVTNGVLYQYSSGAWNSGKSLVGPMGLNGINGSFFTGAGAPTTSTYNGTGQAIYIQTTGEVWTYASQAQGWVDSGENLTGPQGVQGPTGSSTRGSQIFNGSGAPSSNLASFSNGNTTGAMAGDLYVDTTTAPAPTLYILGS